MEFNKLISENLHSLFTEYGLKITTEQLKNIVRYESGTLYVSLAHNDRENSNYFWMGSKYSNDFIEMDNEVMKDFFNSDLQIKNLSQEDFVNNVFLFFTNEGKEILQGNESKLTDLEKFDKLRSEIFTSKLLERQYLDAAEEAWRTKNYVGVLKNLDKIKEENLSKSYRKKYQIAKKKIGKEGNVSN